MAIKNCFCLGYACNLMNEFMGYLKLKCVCMPTNVCAYDHRCHMYSGVVCVYITYMTRPEINI